MQNIWYKKHTEIEWPVGGYKAADKVTNVGDMPPCENGGMPLPYSPVRVRDNFDISHGNHQ